MASVQGPSERLKLRLLTVPAGLEYILIVRDVFSNKGLVEFHLQGLYNGAVHVHESTSVSMDDFEAIEDQTGLCQRIIDELHMRILRKGIRVGGA